MTEEPNFVLDEQKPSIKLTKNTKGYGWEIKIIGLDVDELERINNEMKKRFLIQTFPNIDKGKDDYMEGIDD